MLMHVDTLKDLHEPLAELGRRWAASPHRPRPTQETLTAWDKVLDDWLASDLPIILRDSARRGQRDHCSDGREVIYADNSPANWAYALALLDRAPSLGEFRSETIHDHVPLSFLSKGEAAKRNLNNAGWKVCHIDPVSDRKRYKIGDVEPSRIKATFRRFLSPRNIFLIPKIISGAGELSEVINAVASFEQAARLATRG